MQQQQQQSADELRAMGLVQGMGEYMPQYYSLPDAHGGNTVFMVSQQQVRVAALNSCWNFRLIRF